MIVAQLVVYPLCVVVRLFGSFVITGVQSKGLYPNEYLYPKVSRVHSYFTLASVNKCFIYHVGRYFSPISIERIKLEVSIIAVVR